MTDKHTTEYLKKLGDIRLSPGVKARMKDELDSFARFHSVREAQVDRSIEQVQRNSVFALFTNSKMNIMKATLLIALLIGSAGSSLAAQAAVPGDFFYPVKIHFNENVRSAFAFGAEAEAKLQAEILAERLEEAQKLAARGDLEGDRAAEVNLNISAQLKKTLTASTQADAQTDTAIRSTVSAALVSFKNDLEEMDASVDAGVIADYSATVDAQLQTLGVNAENSLGIEAEGNVDAAAIIGNAQARINSLTSVLSETAALSAEAKANFEADVQAAAGSLVAAQASLQANAEAQAKAHAERSLELIGKVEAALSSMGQVEIDTATGGIIDLNLNGNVEEGSGTEGNAGIEALLDGEASLESDMIDTSAESHSSVTGGLGI